jgi:hypothetical protein
MPMLFFHTGPLQPKKETGVSTGKNGWILPAGEEDNIKLLLSRTCNKRDVPVKEK